MNHLEGTAWLKIHDGKKAEFKKIFAQCVETVKANDPGTLRYDFFYNPDETVCVVKEKYADSAALFAHLGNLGPLLGQVLAVADMDLELYGNPSPELRAALAGANPKIYSFQGGL